MKTPANRIIYNTGILYAKMFISIGVALYSTRLILAALGDADYGLFNLVAGVIAALAFLNTAMTTSTQRYLSISIGEGELEKSKNIFANSLIIHIVISIVLSFILFIIGLFLFNGILNIPETRTNAAKTIYYMMILSLCLSILSAPFLALINAQENMGIVAIIHILEVFLKFCAAVLLTYISGDRLVFYGIAITFISFCSFFSYVSYSLKKYKESTIKIKDRYVPAIIKDMASFASWNLFGSMAGIARYQGLAVILNMALGTVINAAYGIANQVAGQLSFFSANMLKSVNPQIMKKEGAGNRDKMLDLAIRACRYGFLLLAFFSIPFIFEMESILKIWLKDVPTYTTIFCNLILLGVLISQLTVGIQSAVQAIGQIKKYQVIVGTTILLNIPISYILLRLEFPPYSVLISYVIIEICASLLRLSFIRNLVHFPIRIYCEEVLKRSAIVSISSILVCLFVTNILEESYFRVFLTLLFSSICFIITSYFWGIDKKRKSISNQ